MIHKILIRKYPGDKYSLDWCASCSCKVFKTWAYTWDEALENGLDHLKWDVV